MRGTRWRVVVIALAVALVIGLLEFGVGLMGNLGANRLDASPGRWDPFVRHPFITGGILIVVLTAAAVVGSRLSGQSEAGAARDPLQEIDAACEAMALKLRERWLRDMGVALSGPGNSLTVPWQVRDGPAPASNDIGKFFAGLDHRRLVILGQPGSGKTVLSMRLMVALLPQPGQRLAGRPLPVQFSLAGWDPGRTGLRTWLVQELIASFPELASALPGGQSLAEGMLADGRLLPVLDGLDEMVASVRANALRCLSEGLRPTEGAVLTSRFNEYDAAERASGALPGATVLAIADLRFTDVYDYLVSDSSTGRSWAEALRGSDPAVLALRDVLSTPLMVFLARRVCRTAEVTPGKVLALGEAAQIRDKLLAGFVRAAYLAGAGVAPSARDRRRAARAERHVAWIARHLTQLRVVNFRWWHLSYTLSDGDRWLFGIGVGLLVCMLITVASPPFDVLSTIPDGVSYGLCAGIVAGVTITRTTVLGAPVSPVPSRLRRQGHVRLAPATGTGTNRFAWRLGMIFALANGLTWSTISLHLSLYSLVNFVSVTGAGWVSIALAARASTRIVRSVEEPVTLGEAVGPWELHRLDRAAARRKGLYCGLICMIIGGFAYSLLSSLPYLPMALVAGRSGLQEDLLANFVFATTYSMIQVPVIVVFTLIFLMAAWGRFTLVRWYLAAAGRLPWGFEAFLRDAHDKGILRQSGAVYQFRHVEIRDWLAAGNGTPQQGLLREATRAQ